MSPALRDMDTVARMQRALMSVRNLDDDTQRAAAYIRADISDVDHNMFDAEAMRQVRDLYQFDNIFTAPLHGFVDTEDYWRRASAKPRLRDIRIAAYVVNALNDPFIPADSLPQPAQVSASCRLIYTTRGGHVGFVSGAWPPGRVSISDQIPPLNEWGSNPND